MVAYGKQDRSHEMRASAPVACADNVQAYSEQMHSRRSAIMQFALIRVIEDSLMHVLRVAGLAIHVDPCPCLISEAYRLAVDTFAM